jgi:uncharacterized membrane protein
VGWVTSMLFVAIGLVLTGLPVDWPLHKLEFRSILAYGAIMAGLYWFVFPRRRPREDEV